MNSLFDAGSITYLGLWGLAQAFDWSLTGVACFYFGLALISFGGAAYYWTIVEPEGESLAKPTNVTEETNVDAHKTDFEKESNDAGVEDNVSEEKATGGRVGDEGLDDSRLPPDRSDDKTSIQKETSYVLVADRTQMQQIFSGPFLMTLVYTTIMITANQWTLTTTRDFLASLGDDEVGNKYLTIFTLLFPASLAALPCTDAITSKYGFHGGFQAINILALGYSLIRLLSKDLNVQILGFILFSFFRSFFFGVTFSAIPAFLSQDVVGKAMGLTYALAGLASYVNIPLSKLAIETKGGDFFIPNLIYTLLIAPCIITSWQLADAIYKEKNIKERRKKNVT